MSSGLTCRQRAKRQKTVARSRMRSWRSWRWGWRGRRRCWGGRRRCCVPREAWGGQTNFFRFLMPLRPGDVDSVKPPTKLNVGWCLKHPRRLFRNLCDMKFKKLLKHYWHSPILSISRSGSTPMRNDTRAQSCAEILHIVWSWGRQWDTVPRNPETTWESLGHPGTHEDTQGHLRTPRDTVSQDWLWQKLECSIWNFPLYWNTKLKCTFDQATCELDWTFMKSNKRP